MPTLHQWSLRDLKSTCWGMQHRLPQHALVTLLEGRVSLVFELFSPTSPKSGCSPFVHSTRKSVLSLIPVPSCLPRLGLGRGGGVPFKGCGGGGCRRPSFRPSLDLAARGPPGARAPCQRMRPPVGAVPGCEGRERTDRRTDRRRTGGGPDRQGSAESWDEAGQRHDRPYTAARRAREPQPCALAFPGPWSWPGRLGAGSTQERDRAGERLHHHHR